MILKGKKIFLRALEPQDLEFLYELENNSDIWEVSGTITPYSKHVLTLYLDNAHQDIYEAKQLRLCICELSGKLLGFIDLFDFDPKNQRAGIGIVILQDNNRKKGVGSEAVELLCKYAFKTLDLHQLYANVTSDNNASISLFEKMGFEAVGVKKEWIFSLGNYKNEILFQKINR